MTTIFLQTTSNQGFKMFIKAISAIVNNGYLALANEFWSVHPKLRDITSLSLITTFHNIMTFLFTYSSTEDLLEDNPLWFR